MNGLIYDTAYVAMRVMDKIGDRIPKKIIAWCALHIPDEMEARRLLSAGLIDMDQFDVRVDWHCNLVRLHEKNGARS